jgi:hypothetical protein
MYGQQITVPEQLKNNPSIFNNTGDRFLIQNRIPLTLILEPYTHFNQNNSSSTTINNSYTEFKVILGRDIIAPVTIPIAYNVFGQSITGGLIQGDIYTKPDNGTYTGYIPGPNPTDPPTQVTFTNNIFPTDLKVDRIYDVYIESVTTFNILPNTTKNRMAFILEINDWNIDNNANLTNISRSIVIPNEATAVNQTQTHKAKKLNYLTHLTPDTISTISGRISFLDGENIFEATPLSSNDHRISLELILIPRNKN